MATERTDERRPAAPPGGCPPPLASSLVAVVDMSASEHRGVIVDAVRAEHKVRDRAGRDLGPQCAWLLRAQRMNSISW
ncbi:hypothetical protein [Modestobacter altitudinis]|uniref:hypothetical protein n=1 Tax=Modestobacter altitudinis TaxID=2213158 RepID=UPI001486241D|nr:hypothetical protein [Modestobacter altitudinis]